MTDQEIARSIVATLQAATNARDLDAMWACFDADPVLVGSARYNAGDLASRDYLGQVVDSGTSLTWDLQRYDVFLRADGVIGFGAEGEIDWSDTEESGREPFRLTIVAVEADEGWRIRHFHGSLPDA